MAFFPDILGLGRQRRHFFVAVAAGALGPFAVAALVPALQACSSDGTTSGKRVVLRTQLELKSEDLRSFDNGLGWHVTLEHAWVSTGAFGYFDGVPPIVTLRAEPPSDLGRLAFERLLGVSVAHAHPGHYQAGNALGEMTEPASVDLLRGTSTLPDGDGVTGTYRSARFSFGDPPTGPFADELDGHAAVLEGSAELDGETPRHFRAVADVAELAKIQPQGNIDGCQFDEVAIAQDGTVTVRVDPSVWFFLVDFSELDPSTRDDPSEFVPDTQPRLAFAQGLAQLSAYEFSYSK